MTVFNPMVLVMTQAGNNNHFTASGFETAAISNSNPTNDVDIPDTPTNNHITLNPEPKSALL